MENFLAITSLFRSQKGDKFLPNALQQLLFSQMYKLPASLAQVLILDEELLQLG